MAWGEEGDDTFHAQDRSNTAFNGGPGHDRFIADGFTDYGLEYDAAGAQVEEIYGTEFPDRITGTDAAELIDGRRGDDTIVGNGGNDTLVGGDGNDVINAGPGDDTLFARETNPNPDPDFSDILNGGPGTDTGQVDPEDETTSIETLLA